MTFNGTVLILGATGQTGIHVVPILRKHGIPARALVRSLDKGQTLAGEGLTLIQGDLTEALDHSSLLNGVTAIISALGATGQIDPQRREEVEYHSLVRLIDAAKVAGVDQFVFTTSIGTETPEAYPFIETALRIKRKSELHLIDSGLPYTIIRPGGLVNDPPQYTIKIGPPRTIQGRISRADVAQVLVQALLQPEARNGIFEIVNSPEAGPADRPHLFA